MESEDSGDARSLPVSVTLPSKSASIVVELLRKSYNTWLSGLTEMATVFRPFVLPTPNSCPVPGESSMTRISRDEMLMAIALVVKQRSTCLRRQVGAVLALDGRIISTGYNGAPSGVAHCTPNVCNAENPCVDTIHAEANAIAFAARNGISTRGASLYSTASPCRECAKLLINAGITEVVYNEEYRDTSPIDLLTGVGIRVRRG